MVLIGAFNNDWTTRLTGALRYTFAGSPASVVFIEDAKAPDRRDWAVDMSTPFDKLTNDYAIVTRARNPLTGRIVVVAAGLTIYGTLAAGEFLTTPQLMSQLVRNAPRGWDGMNLQVVLSTPLIKGSPGSPGIAAVHYW